MKKVFKYATGEAIPEGAVYLSTQVEKTITTRPMLVSYGSGERDYQQSTESNTLVWHYFLVEVKEN